jgi:hypothetical protein
MHAKRMSARLSARSLRMEGKAIAVTGRGGPCGCETSSITHFLDNRLTDGGEVVSLTRRQPCSPMKIPGIISESTPGS